MLVSGAVEAMAGLEPFLTLTEEKMEGKSTMLLRLGKHVQGGGLFLITDKWAAANPTKIPDVVKAHTSGHVIMVDMSTLPTSDIRGNGNVHPTDQGYADMANLWYGAIKSYLPQ